MLRRVTPFFVIFAVSFAVEAAAQEKPLVLDVWPGNAPGVKGDLPEETVKDARPGEAPVMRLTNVTKPTIAVYRAPADKNTGTAVLIAPGGGYNILAYDKEGTEVAEWLNSIGVTGIVLKYRVPRREDDPKGEPPVGPLQDAQRALSLIRSQATSWGVDPQRIGMLGFSAGGHLTASTATNFDRRAYDKIDGVDEQSCRPDFAVLIYPAYLVNDKGEFHSTIHVSKDTPPCFFAHAHDDRISPVNSARMYIALKEAGVTSELHIYSAGGHGFGLRASDDACSTWPARCEAWMKQASLLTK